jgi:hypothetical protein
MAEQSIKRVARFTCRLDDGAQNQSAGPKTNNGKPQSRRTAVCGLTAAIKWFKRSCTIHQELPRFDFRSGDPQMVAVLVDA